MKKSICLVSSIIMLMSGCLYDDDEVVTSSTALSLGTATISDATAKEVFVDDFKLSLNPTFIINGEIATYTNDLSGNFPVTTASKDMKVVYTNEGDGIKLTFSFVDNSEGDIFIVMSEFIDVGNEGYIDEIEISDVRVNVSPSTPEGTQVPEHIGPKRLEKPLARHIDDISNSLGADYALPAQPAIVDYNGSPTLEEWNQHVVGKALISTGMDGDIWFNWITSSSDVQMYVLAGYDKGKYKKSGIIYEYSQINEDDGLFVWKHTFEETEEGDSNYGDMVEQKSTVKLLFDDFFSGDFETIEEQYTNTRTGAVSYDQDLGSGTFKYETESKEYISNTSNFVPTEEVK